MEILASKKVCEGGPIKMLHKENDTWFIISEQDNFEELSINDDSFFIYEEDALYGRIPKLKGQLNQKNKTTINVDYKTGEININEQHFHIGIPTHSAKSSRQANTSFSFFRWFRNNPKEYKGKLITIIILLILSKFVGWFFYIPLILYAAFHILSLFKTRDMFYSGDLTPGIVIDATNSKIAVLTNLSLGRGDYPIIRIRKVGLPKEYIKNGQKLAIAGVYQNTENHSHWDYFDTFPLISGMANVQEHEGKINLIHSSEWARLKSEITKFSDIPKEGYYPLDIETSSWKDKDLASIKFMQFDEEK